MPGTGEESAAGEIVYARSRITTAFCQKSSFVTVFIKNL